MRRGFAEAQKRRETRLSAATQLLGAVGYRSVLARGFALVRDAAGAPLPRAAAIAPGHALRIQFADDTIGATADGRGGDPPTQRARPKVIKGQQGSLF